MVEVHRKELTGAKYNPRILSDAQRRKLKTGLKRHGLVAPITWNRTTGNIVGGHQRLSILDSLMGTSDYTMKVSAIEVPIEREKELNILLNNTSAQGDWDIAALENLLKDDDVKLEGTGFDSADIYKMFGGNIFAERDEDLAALAEKLETARATYEQISKKNKDRESTDFYLVVVFSGEPHMMEFLKRHGLPENRYQSAEDWTALAEKKTVDGAAETVAVLVPPDIGNGTGDQPE